MLPQLTITFRHVPRSGAVESAAREFGYRLELVNDRISACHITVERRATLEEGTGEYAVKIHLSVPGAQIHAESAQCSGARHLDARPALRSAFDNAKCQLESLKNFRVGSPQAVTW
jgi:sigma 54 modulation/S30EA-like ribosomal protein